MNNQFDLIIIGDSKEGNQLLTNIASANTGIKIAFISRDFKRKTSHEFLSVDYIKEEVVFTDYKNRLFGCYLKSGLRLYATHLVFAVGQKYAPFMLENKKVPNVFNTAVDIPKEAKDLQAIVLGHTTEDIKLTLEVAKKYRHVYLCSKPIELEGTERQLKKLAEAKNVVVLPNTQLVGLSTQRGNLKTVELDNYSTITCSAIFVKTATKPDTSCVSKKLIKCDDLGYLETDRYAESTLVPKCFAIGTCAQRNTKRTVANLTEKILNNFGGPNNVNS